MRFHSLRQTHNVGLASKTKVLEYALNKLLAEWDDHTLSVDAAFDTPNQARLIVAQVAPRRAGRFDFTVRLTPVMEDGSALPSIPVKMWGNVLSNLSVVPSNLALGICRVSDKCSADVVLEDRGKRTLEETVVAKCSPNVGVAERFDCRTDRRRVFQITVTIDAAGPGAGEVEFKEPDGSLTTASLSYVGVVP